ncbi:hypothetical protein GEMRC1_010374 [Eukaryota sp. GEM-RC1]
MGVERAQRGAKVVVQQLRQGDPSQQWIVYPDGTIRNAASNHVIDVERGQIQSPGAGLFPQGRADHNKPLATWTAKNPASQNQTWSLQPAQSGMPQQHFQQHPGMQQQPRMQRGGSRGGMQQQPRMQRGGSQPSRGGMQQLWP